MRLGRGPASPRGGAGIRPAGRAGDGATASAMRTVGRASWTGAPHAASRAHTLNATPTRVVERIIFGGTYFFVVLSDGASVDRAATNASCGTSTRPMVFIRFLP